MAICSLPAYLVKAVAQLISTSIETFIRTTQLWPGWVQKMIANSSITSQINSRYNQSDPSAQAGQPFVLGYQPIDMSAITGNRLFTTKIFACAVNPSQTPHLIDSGRFNNTGTPSSCYAPSNSISAQGLANNTTNGANLLCSALACAMLGAYDNQYPINMPYGWIRIQNGKDAIAANPNTLANVFPPLTGTGLNGLSYNVPDVGVPLYASNGNTIFNIQLWTGPGGEGGIYESNNHVFGTVDYEDPNNSLTPGPPGYNVVQEFNAWVNANTHPCTGSCVPDANGLDPTLDPNLPQPNGTYICGYQSPTPNMRAATVSSNGTVTTTYNQLATVQNMLGITSYSGPCITTELNDAGSTSSYCQDVPLWTNNYFNPNDYWVPAYDAGTQATGGLTDLEAVKGEVIGALDRLWIQCRNAGITNVESSSQFMDYTFTLTVPQNPSGSKVYGAPATAATPFVHDGLEGYATPQDVPGVAFGTIATPLQLIQQLGNNQPSTATTNCGDASTSSSQWTDTSTPLGKLLQRCQMIAGSTTATDLINLLNTYKIDLNEYQYIYLPVGATKLAISNSPPAFLQQIPGEFSTPGSMQPDGTPLASCQDQAWTRTGNGQTSLDINYSLVNSDMNYGANGSSGDDTTSGPPFTSYSGNLSSWDGMTFTPSSGRYWFLGNLQFGNYVSGGGTSNTFGQPN